MPFPVTIGSDAQPNSGFAVVMSSVDTGGSMLDFTVPDAVLGAILMIIIVRNDGAIDCSSSSWVKTVEGVGGSGLYIDVYKRTVDGTTGSNAGDVISFLSLAEQELQGIFLVVENSVAAAPVEAVRHSPFTSTTAPASPEIESSRRTNKHVCIWSADTDVALTAPDGFEVLDFYASAPSPARTMLAAVRDAGIAGTVAPVLATSAPAASGRSFALIIAGIYTGSGHLNPDPPARPTNPSRHARKTP